MSRHHNNEIKIIKIKFIIDIKLNLKFIIITLEIIKLKIFIDIKIGHGLKFKIK